MSKFSKITVAKALMVFAGVAAVAMAVIQIGGPVCRQAVATSPQRGSEPVNLLKRGINFGNMLEAPSEGEWGLTVEERFFDLVVAGGFDHIRLPVSWSTHADTEAPFAVEETFFERVDWVVDQATRRGIRIIVNVHHYDEIHDDPVAQWDRAMAIWDQIATRYQDCSDLVYFELLNEPHGMFDDVPQLWNDFVAASLDQIRETNPTRKVLIGPNRYNNVAGLRDLVLPDDPNIIATVHCYDPFLFSHQGTSWVQPPIPVGTRWNGRWRRVSDRFQDWSYGASLSDRYSGVVANFHEGYGSVVIHAHTPLEDASQLVFRTNKSVKLRIYAQDANGETGAVLVTTPAGTATTRVPLEGIRSDLPMTEIAIQNDSPDALRPFLISRLDIYEGRQRHMIVATEQQVVRDLFDDAAQWAAAQGVDLHLGEFGAYKSADDLSRERWTATMRRLCDQRGISWSYWELAAGFGVYDPDNNRWRERLMRTLVPTFVP